MNYRPLTEIDGQCRGIGSVEGKLQRTKSPTKTPTNESEKALKLPNLS